MRSVREWSLDGASSCQHQSRMRSFRGNTSTPNTPTVYGRPGCGRQRRASLRSPLRSTTPGSKPGRPRRLRPPTQRPLRRQRAVPASQQEPQSNRPPPGTTRTGRHRKSSHGRSLGVPDRSSWAPPTGQARPEPRRDAPLEPAARTPRSCPCSPSTSCFATGSRLRCVSPLAGKPDAAELSTPNPDQRRCWPAVLRSAGSVPAPGAPAARCVFRLCLRQHLQTQPPVGDYIDG